jgi:hypothetical protein
MMAQNCIDSIRIKGYYVVIRLKNEIGRAKPMQKNKTTKVLEQRIDVHYTASVIPFDSINKKHDLAYLLNHLWNNTTQVFTSCEKVDLKYFSSCLDPAEKRNCSFPILKTDRLYYITNLNSAEVYEIYFIDAYWARIKMQTNSIEASMIPSRVAQTSITATEFTLYYFVSSKNIKLNPSIKDSHVKLWKK